MNSHCLSLSDYISSCISCISWRAPSHPSPHPNSIRRNESPNPWRQTLHIFYPTRPHLFLQTLVFLSYPPRFLSVFFLFFVSLKKKKKTSLFTHIVLSMEPGILGGAFVPAHFLSFPIPLFTLCPCRPQMCTAGNAVGLGLSAREAPSDRPPALRRPLVL